MGSPSPRLRPVSRLRPRREASSERLSSLLSELDSGASANEAGVADPSNPIDGDHADGQLDEPVPAGSTAFDTDEVDESNNTPTTPESDPVVDAVTIPDPIIMGKGNVVC